MYGCARHSLSRSDRHADRSHQRAYSGHHCQRRHDGVIHERQTDILLDGKQGTARQLRGLTHLVQLVLHRAYPRSPPIRGSRNPARYRHRRRIRVRSVVEVPSPAMRSRRAALFQALDDLILVLRQHLGDHLHATELARNSFGDSCDHRCGKVMAPTKFIHQLLCITGKSLSANAIIATCSPSCAIYRLSLPAFPAPSQVNASSSAIPCRSSHSALPGRTV